MKTLAAFNRFQARNCPARKSTPRAVPAVHQPLNLARAPDLSARRASSRARLDASKIAVLTSKMGGLGMETQSSLRPRRTTMVLAASNTYNLITGRACVRRDSVFLRGSYQPPHRRQQGWNLAFDDAPHQILVRTLVLVDEYVAQVAHLAPGNRGEI